MHDDLLRPALADHTADGAGSPWRLVSQFYVVILGGALAVTAIAVLNARRLRLSSTQQLLILAVGVAGFAGTLAVAAATGPDPAQRYAVRLPAVVAWGAMYAVQRSADRGFAFHEGDAGYASLWVPGALACAVGGLAQWLLVGAISGDVA